MNNRGFTLVEVIVVMVMLGIMLAIALPSMTSWRETARVREVAQDILGGLRHARSMAVTENQTVIATLDLANHQLTYNGVVKGFPSNIVLEADVDTDLSDNSDPVSTTFQPHGSCTAELYIRVNEDQNLEIQIGSTATGLARMQNF